MVGTPVSRRETRHQRTASFRALCAIRSISPERPEDRRAKRNRIRRDQRRRANAAFYRGLLEYWGVQVQPRQRRRQPVQRRLDPDLPIVLSSDTSGEDLPPPEQSQLGAVVVDIDSSIDELPNIAPDHSISFRCRSR